jgi:hypothetical protein
MHYLLPWLPAGPRSLAGDDQCQQSQGQGRETREDRGLRTAAPFLLPSPALRTHTRLPGWFVCLCVYTLHRRPEDWLPGSKEGNAPWPLSTGEVLLVGAAQTAFTSRFLVHVPGSGSCPPFIAVGSSLRRPAYQEVCWVATRNPRPTQALRGLHSLASCGAACCLESR